MKRGRSCPHCAKRKKRILLKFAGYTYLKSKTSNRKRAIWKCSKCGYIKFL